MAEHSGTNTLAFGHAQLAKAVVKRIQRHFHTDATQRSAVEQSLVVGVFGEWGSGKSSLLHAVKQDFDDQPDEAAPVVTVFFNAWRYEKEPHLIVPLLKSVQAEIKRLIPEETETPPTNSLKQKLGKLIPWFGQNHVTEPPLQSAKAHQLAKGSKFFGSAAQAFVCAHEATVTFKQTGFPVEVSLKTSPKAAVEMFRATQDRKKLAAPKPSHYAKLDEYDTLYLEFERQLRELTDSDPALNLLFFIDDLDRCLPEKALEMLEAIKLFFDVPRCVFVLAVDDEVVERGVQHRYRDYLFEANKTANAHTHADASHRLPITGAEYLEKIIHLPLRLPPAQAGQAEQFLRERYPDLFDYQAKANNYEDQALVEEEYEASRQRLAHGQQDKQQENTTETPMTSQAKQLLRHTQQQFNLGQLFTRAVPPVPRKLQRSAELLHMQLNTSQQLGLGIDQYPDKVLLLARLAIWQCFAPELFRLCRRQPSRFLRIAKWFAEGKQDFGLIDADADTEKTIYGENQGDALAELKELRRQVATSRHQRSEFDLKDLFTPYDPSDFSRIENQAKSQQNHHPIPTWNDIDLITQLAQLGLALQINNDPPADSAILKIYRSCLTKYGKGIYGRVANVEEFLKLLFSKNPADSHDALHHRLQGGPLPPLLVEKVVSHHEFDQVTPYWLGQLLTQLAPTEAHALPPTLARLATHRSAFTACAFLPNSRHILTASHDHTAKLWDAHSGTLVRSFDGHTSSVLSCAFSVDGQHILTASNDNTTKLWEVQSGKLLRSFDGHTSSVLSCAFSADGQHILTTSNDKTAKLWEVHTGELLHSFNGHTHAVNCCTFSPDGQHILTAGNDKTAKLWDAYSGALLHSFDGHTRAVNGCAFSPDGLRILTASNDSTTTLWDIHSGAPLHSFHGHANSVRSCAFSPDGQHILTASDDKTAKQWDAHSGALVRSFDGHTDWVRSGIFSPNGLYILTASHDKTAKLWDTHSGALLRSFDDHTASVFSCTFSPNGLHILTASRDKTAKLWDAHSGALLRSFDDHIGSVNSCAFSADGQHILTASNDKTAKLWDTKSGGLVRSFDGHTDSVLSCTFSTDGQHVLTTSADHTAKLWEVQSGVLLHSFNGHTNWVLSGTFSTDDQHILTASWDYTTKLWDTLSGTLLRAFDGRTASVFSGAFSVDSQSILTASADNTAKLWATQSGELLRAFHGHTDWVRSGIFSPNGQHILTASDDKTAKLWDAHSGTLVRSFASHTDWVRSCAFSPDGQHILTASDDSTTRLWDTSTGELVRTFFASQADNLALSWPSKPQDFLDRRCTLRTINPDQPIDLSKPRNWILQDQRLTERQPVRTWPLDVLIGRYGDEASQAVLANAHTAPSSLPAQPTEST